ncbi:MAG: hypothetical protein ACRBB0_22345 [Pelagimonas sp.]|uniref:hypothetical protein n=1 Tax=Pelagimonas sp. TaxID=2073170 RepID=UPI003D6BB09A
MSVNGWSIAIGEDEVIGISGYSHTSGLLIDPEGNVVASVDVQPVGPAGIGVVNIGPRDVDPTNIHIVVSGLSASEAAEMYDSAAEVAGGRM